MRQQSEALLVVIDGKGGGLGAALIGRIRERLQAPAGVRLVALGTNASATTAMLRAGADDAATGENAIVHMCARADLIIGPLAIVASGAMLGEISQQIATAVAESPAPKLLVPTERCGIMVAGVAAGPQRLLLDEVAERVAVWLCSSAAGVP
ncbi:MAG: DUF3842 family protein [Bacillota bacterium]|nr:DUF3842 family protein [Bacillota bacterium]